MYDKIHYKLKKKITTKKKETEMYFYYTKTLSFNSKKKK